MGRHLVTSLATAALAVAQLGLVTPAFAQSDAALEAARRVNISGRQRMLSQQISKATCFLHIGAETEGKPNQLADAVALFAASLEALQAGDREMGLSREINVPIFEALQVVANTWGEYAALLPQGPTADDLSKDDLAQIDRTGLTLLSGMNRVVNMTANTYGDALPDMPLILSMTIDLAGRQRMLVQKAAKEFCLVVSEVEVAENRARLAKTAEIFSLTLGALQAGMPGMVMAAPNAEITGQLQAVAAAWEAPKAALLAVAQGESPGAAQLNEVVNGLEQVLALMNEAVGMYEGAIPQ